MYIMCVTANIFHSWRSATTRYNILLCYPRVYEYYDRPRVKKKLRRDLYTNLKHDIVIRVAVLDRQVSLTLLLLDFYFLWVMNKVYNVGTYLNI